MGRATFAGAQSQFCQALLTESYRAWILSSWYPSFTGVWFVVIFPFAKNPVFKNNQHFSLLACPALALICQDLPLSWLCSQSTVGMKSRKNEELGWIWVPKGPYISPAALERDIQGINAANHPPSQDLGVAKPLWSSLGMDIPSLDGLLT